MPNIASVTKYFPSAREGFTTTSSGSISSGAVTVPLNSTTGYTNGDTVVMVIDPSDAVKKQAFTGVIDTSGNQVTSVVWTEGTNQAHSTGATVVDYVTATHMSMATKGILVHANQDGTLKTSAVQTALGISSSPSDGWNLLTTTPTVATGYNVGQKEFNLTFSNVDLSNTLQAGMRLKVTRGTTAPTQCTSLNGTTQFANRSASINAITFTDDFTIEAWIKINSYNTVNNQAILSRFNGTSGFAVYVSTSGIIEMRGFNAASANFSGVTSYQSVPLNQWVHIAVRLDMSSFSVGTTTSQILINGAAVPCFVSRGGTNPTALVQAGNLELGSYNSGTNFLNGKLADVRLWNTLRTNTQVQDNMSQQLVGNESGLVSYWKLNGDFNDSNANANNLTAQAAATATNADNPMKSTEYAIITKVSYSNPNTTVTVFGGADYQIPNMTLTSPYYSAQKAPVGFNAARSKWRVATYQVYNSGTIAYGGTNLWTSSVRTLIVPTGEWAIGFTGEFEFASSVSGTRSGFVLLSATTPVNSVYYNDLQWRMFANGSADTLTSASTISIYPHSLTSQTTYTLYTAIDSSTGAETFALRGDQVPIYLYAESAYV